MVGQVEAVGAGAGPGVDVGGGEGGGVRDVVDELTAEGRDGAGGGHDEALDGAAEFLRDGDGGTGARDALVEVAKKDDGRGRGKRAEVAGEGAQEGDVILPGLAVAVAGADVGVFPRDADADEADIADGGIGDAADEAPVGEGGVFGEVDSGPGGAAPEDDFAAAGLEGVAVIGRGVDLRAIGREEAGGGFGEADGVEAGCGEMLLEGGAAPGSGRRPFGIPCGELEAHFSEGQVSVSRTRLGVWPAAPCGSEFGD